MSTGYTVSLSSEFCDVGGSITLEFDAVSSAFVGGEQITLTANGGTFSSPSGGSYDSGTGVFTLPSGPSCTIVWTGPAGPATGTYTVSYVNNQSWTDASNSTLDTYKFFSVSDCMAGFFGPLNINSHSANTLYMSYHGTFWEMQITGTLAIFQATVGGDGYTFTSVDGGAETDPGSGRAIFTGLSDSPRIGRVRVQDGALPYNVQFPSSGTFLYVKGSNPSIAVNPAYGPYKRFGDPTFPGNVASGEWISGNANASDGVKVYGQAGAVGWPVQVRFKAQTTGFRIHSAFQGADWTIDGVRQTLASLGSVPVWGVVGSGLDSTAMHEYVVTLYGSHSGTDSMADGVVLDVGGTFGSYPSPLKQIAILGDSIAYGAGLAGRLTQTDIFLISEQVPFGAFSRGISGNTTADCDTRYADDVGSITDLDILVIQSGYNDNNVTDPTAFKASYTSVINKALTQGCGKVICRGIEPLNQAIDTLIQQVVATVADSRVVYYDPYTGTVLTQMDSTGSTFKINSITDGYSADGGHPAYPGYQLMTAVEVPFFQSLFGPAITGLATDETGLIVTGAITAGCTPTSGTGGSAGQIDISFDSQSSVVDWSISGDEITYNLNYPAYPDQTIRMVYAGEGPIVDGSGNPLASFTLLPTNNSTATVPTPSAPGGYAVNGGAHITFPIPADPNLGANLYRDTTAVVQGSRSPTPFDDTGLSNGTSYIYKLSYAPSGGDEGAQSSGLTVTPPNSPPKPAFGGAASASSLLLLLTP